MSFVTTRTEALTAAATKLETFGSAMATQNAAAAAPTTGVAPAAADEVSALQAAQFSAYGNWYQQVSAQAAAIHQALVNTLGANAGSYSQTEAANQAATSAAPLAQATLPGSSADSVIGTPIGWGQNFSAAASDFLELAQGQFVPTAESGGPSAAAGLSGEVGAAAAPGASAGVGAAPVLAGSGGASSVNALSVPPSWAASAVPASSATPATLAGAGWSSAAPETAPVSTVPAGMPAVASAGREGAGLGMPRYGAKPTVMPKPTVV